MDHDLTLQRLFRERISSSLSLRPCDGIVKCGSEFRMESDKEFIGKGRICYREKKVFCEWAFMHKCLIPSCESMRSSMVLLKDLALADHRINIKECMNVSF